MFSKKENQMHLPEELWKHIKSFLLTKPTCLLCVQAVEKTKLLNPFSSSGFLRKQYQDKENPGQYLCKCTTSPTGSLSFSYVCNHHYALNTQMKITLGQKSLFFKVRETYATNAITMKKLRQGIQKIPRSDILRLLCSKKDKKLLADEILRLCDIVL